MKKKLSLLLVAAFAIFAADAAVPHPIILPDIDGYMTLKGDMHIHTVFSDGSVWPTTRVEEAMMDGLDVIAITDHVDTRLQKYTNKGMFKCDRNESYRIAAAAGKAADILVIHGGEISRGMPPGHWNALFIDDNDAIAAAAEKYDDDHVKAMRAGLKEARRQGAFTVWNHPHWERQAQNETRWYDEHTHLYDEGYMHGIEIYNGFCGYSPEAHRWAIDRGCALISGTDTHKPLFLTVDYDNGMHRPVTLIFARERTLDGVREALDNRRTAVLADEHVYGSEELIGQLFSALFEVSDIKYSEKKVTFKVVNRSSVPLSLSKAPGSEKVVFPRDMIVRPFEVMTMTIYGLDNKKPIGLDSFDVNFYVNNFLTEPGKPLVHSIHFDMSK